MMKGGIGQLMKQAQQMQADMQKAQEEMASITVTGESGGGMVPFIRSLWPPLARGLGNEGNEMLALEIQRCWVQFQAAIGL